MIVAAHPDRNGIFRPPHRLAHWSSSTGSPGSTDRND
jgi:hypothetical protein